MPKGYISVLEASKRLKVNKSRVLAFIRQGRLEAHKAGNIYLISEDAFSKLVIRPTGRPRMGEQPE